MENKTNVCLTDGEMSQLKHANTSEEWLRIHDNILASRGGQYPPDWTEKTLTLFLEVIENL